MSEQRKGVVVNGETVEQGNIYNTYKRIFSENNTSVWEWNISKNQMYVSNSIKNLTNSNSNSFNSMTEFINNLSYEEDTVLAQKDLKDFINGYVPFYQSTFRIKTDNDEIKWVLLKGSFTTNEEDGSKCLSGILSEVLEIKLLERYDGLTLLPNRKFFFKKINNLIRENIEKNKKGALIYIDLDNFKSINANWGNFVGDVVLKLFTQRLTDMLGDKAELARLGGDEFIIIVPEFSKLKEVQDVCVKIHNQLHKPFDILDTQIYISASLGVAIFPDDSFDADELIKFCDFAIYKSKHKGKNICTFFNKQMSDSYYRENLIKLELKNSIINNELDIVYQPQYDALSNEITGVESLLRWNSNKLGKISPAEFIPIAEKSGLIVQIGHWILKRVMKSASRWINKGYRFNKICVNVSPVQLGRSDFIEDLLAVCKEYNVPPSIIEIEITESTLLENAIDKAVKLNELKEKGINIAIDDFGTGYSSLNYLIELPINTLKIDKSIIDNICCYKNKAVVQSIVSLSKPLKFKIVTEGVESKEQVELLTDLGCNTIQGFYYCKPLSQEMIERLFKKSSQFK